MCVVATNTRVTRTPVPQTHRIGRAFPRTDSVNLRHLSLDYAQMFVGSMGKINNRSFLLLDDCDDCDLRLLPSRALLLRLAGGGDRG